MRTIRVTKGRDAYLKMTPLADYCRQKGWEIVREYVDIRMPEGAELEELRKDVREGRIEVIDPGKDRT